MKSLTGEALDVDFTKGDNVLSGIPFGVKDNYSTRGVLSTGSSNTLKE